MKLYDYYRSSCSYRVRIALQWKQLSYETISIDLTQDQQHSYDYQQYNPQALVPALEDDGVLLTQSLAIIDYLEEQYPSPSVLPDTILARAQVRSMALMIACDIHPLNNLRVLNTLRQDWQATPEQIKQWYHRWLQEGFDAIENTLSEYARQRPFCYANQVTLADICLIPQVYNALRYDLSMEPYPQIKAIYKHCMTLPAFVKAQP